MKRLLVLLTATAAAAALTQQPVTATAATGDSVSIAVPSTSVARDGCLGVPVSVTHTLESAYNTRARLSVALKDGNGKVLATNHADLKWAADGTTDRGMSTCFSWSAGSVYTVEVTLTRSTYEYCVRGYDNELYCTGLESFGTATATATATTTAIETVDVVSKHRARLNESKRAVIASFRAEPTPSGPYVQGDTARWSIRVNGKLQSSVELNAGDFQVVKVPVRPCTTRPTWVDIKRDGTTVQRIKVKPVATSR